MKEIGLVMLGYMWMIIVIGCYIGLWIVTCGYVGLWVVISGYRWLWVVIDGYRCLYVQNISLDPPPPTPLSPPPYSHPHNVQGAVSTRDEAIMLKNSPFLLC